MALPTPPTVQNISADGAQRALYMACSKGHVDIAKTLITHFHLDVNRRLSNSAYAGRSALAVACGAGNSPAVVDLLLQHGAVIGDSELQAAASEPELFAKVIPRIINHKS